MSLSLLDIRNRVTRILQDTSSQNRRWPDVELNDYIFDAQHEFIRLTGFPLKTVSVDLQGLVPEYDVPTATSNSVTYPALMEIRRARVRNRSVEIPIISSTVLDESTSFLHEPVYADWRSQVGPIRAVVLDHRSASTFRLFPIPSGTLYTTVTATLDSVTNPTVIVVSDASDLSVGMYVGGNSKIDESTAIASISGTSVTLTKSVLASGSNESVTFVSSNVFSSYLLQTPTTDVDSISGTDLLFDSSGFFQGTVVVLPSISLQGTIQPPRNALQTYANVADGSDVPLIGQQYHEALVYGAVERAYLKENELRNVQKSSAFRERFLQYVAEARRLEHESRTRRIGGANRVRMKVSRRWV